MTNREHIQQQLSAYIDGELNAAEVSAVEQALAGDPELARELKQLKATRELLRHVPVEHAPDDFAARVLAQTERRRLVHLHAPARRDINWLRYSVVAAVALIAVSVGMVTVIGIYSANKVHPNLLAAKPAANPPAPVEGLAAADRTGGAVEGKGGVFGNATERAERKMEEGQAADNNVLICTDDLPKARKELESQLGKNSIQYKSRWSGDEEAVVVADVDSSQVSRLNKVISDLRSSNRGAELSGRQLRQDKSQEQAAVASRGREKSAGDELNDAKFAAKESQKRDDLAKKGCCQPGGDQAGGRKAVGAESKDTKSGASGVACDGADSARMAKAAPSERNATKPGAAGGAVSKVSGPTTRPAAQDDTALALADKDKVDGEHSEQKAQSAPMVPAAPARIAMASSQAQSNLRRQSNSLALRVQITLQYHPALTQSFGAAQNQSGGQAGQNSNPSSQPCTAQGAATQPDHSRQNPDR
jgi:hypothetical protein